MRGFHPNSSEFATYVRLNVTKRHEVNRSVAGMNRRARHCLLRACQPTHVFMLCVVAREMQRRVPPCL
jgi:hypothetical protein